MTLTSALASAVIFILGLLVILRAVRLRLKKDHALKRFAPEAKNDLFKEEFDFAFNGKKKQKTAKTALFRIPIFGAIYRNISTLGHWHLVVPAMIAPFILAYPMALVLPLPLFAMNIKYALGVFLGANIVMAYTGMQAAKYQKMLLDDIPVFLDSMTRGLRVGKSFEDQLATVGDELNPPMKRIVDELHKGISVGFDPADLFVEQGDRTGVDGFYFVAAALSANQISGGSMAPGIDSLSEQQRMNKELVMKVKSLTSEANFAGYFLAGLPFFFLVFLTMTKPRFTQHLYDTLTGHWVLVGATGAIYIAVMIMRKLASIKV